MLKISKYTLIAIGIIAITLILAKFAFGGNSDRWVCTKGQWVAHGVPKNLPPENYCSEDGKVVSDFQGCLDMGFTLIDSQPPSCETPNGHKYIQGIK